MKPVRVLIVEDDRSNAIAIQQQLKDEGFEVAGVAISGEETIELTKALQPDIILMDIHIEGEMDGVETAKNIQQFADTPIVYLTAHSDDETVDRAKRTQAYGFLLKPFNARELSITIEMAMYKHKAENELKESRLRLSTILASIPSAVIQTDSNLNIVFMNPAAEIFTQQTMEKAIGKSAWETLDIRELQTDKVPKSPAQMVLGKDLTGGTAAPVSLYSASGEKRIIQPWGLKTLTSNATLQGYIIVLNEITQQFEAETELRRMATALASMEDAVIITEQKFTHGGPTIVYTNLGFERILGYNRESVIGEGLFDLVQSTDDKDFYNILESSLKKGNPFQGDIICRRKDNKELQSHWSATPVKNNDSSIINYVFIIRDVTHVRRLEENIRQSQKIEAVGRLAGGIAHDFNNLLSVINSYSELLTLKIDPSSPFHKYAKQISDAGKKGASLVSQLMTFSRRDKPEPTLLNLPNVCDEVKNMLRRVIRENVDLKTEYEKNTWQVRADQGQIEQCLINLCVNARDAMPNGGNITIRINNKPITNTEASQMGLSRGGNYISLNVSDSGCGMDDETIKHIFDPFFTTKEIGKGTGLGLSTVFGIVRNLSGTVNVESKLGEGSTFHLIFPAEIKSETENKGETSIQNAPEGNETIYIIEDDETFLDCITSLLELHGYNIKAYGTGQEALEFFDKEPTKIKLLISDIVLPKLSGREVATRMLEKQPDLKVIFMTGYDDQLDTFYSFPGDTVILEKPFPLNTLLHKVREILDTESALKNE